MSATRRVQQWATFARVWHIYDAKWQNPFHSAKLIAKYLRGLHKPIYHPLNDSGDHVVVVNCKHIALPGDEWKKRVYFHHTGYPGGASWTLAWELHKRDPSMIVRKAVYGAMPGNLQRRYAMERLHLYDEENVPQEILRNVSSQLRQLRIVPKKLNNYSEEEILQFPKLKNFPDDYILE
ncbi:54S ribosomal protein L13 [Polyplax serrata]|uniref:54S ribosomal protein L13 n=1 Tax=Polyplax serrata TaxID=468196 RepID=A0ABR1AR57_POLSC